MSLTLHEISKDTLRVKDKTYHYYSLPMAEKVIGNITRLPKSLKVLLENLLRWQDEESVTTDSILSVAKWLKHANSSVEISYRPVRVLMQDFTGVPTLIDLAAMREAVKYLGGNPKKVNPISPVDLVIDHSIAVDHFGSDNAFKENTRLDMERNHERYVFLKWSQRAFSRFSVVPPGNGICHQINLEYLGKAVWSELQNKEWIAYPDTLIGTDSHTTMINSLGILGWGVGGIEAEAVLLGQPISMLIPDVVGFKLTGKLREGITATDLVLTITQMLRKHNVVGKFVEFSGNGLSSLPLADRATIANMAPEYGATCGFFPIDNMTLDYMRLSGRSEEQISLVETYAKAQGMWRNDEDEPIFTSTLELNMADVKASIAGPKHPQDRVSLENVPKAFITSNKRNVNFIQKDCSSVDYVMNGNRYHLSDGAVVIAAITSCTNTSNPSMLMAAGLLAKKAIKLGIKCQPWVKTSLAPGSRVVSEYLAKANLSPYLNALGFNLVGYGCTTCIGNSGPLPEPIEQAINQGDLTVSAVLSGNRNFEGRIHPLVKTSWLASPPLVVAYALAGNMKINLTKDPIGYNRKEKPVYLKDIWPSSQEIAYEVDKVSTEIFHKEYARLLEGTSEWKAIGIIHSDTYLWQENSTYIRPSPFFNKMTLHPQPLIEIRDARILAILGDSITTDHISPAGNIKVDSPAGFYLKSCGVASCNFNSYGSRRGNHEVMIRGTFSNTLIRNEMVPNVSGGMTRLPPSKEVIPIYDAAMKYQQEGIPLVIIAGKEYGIGSSRDWAAKGPRLLGVKVIIAESFERIHRSNLIGMGILPLEFPKGVTRKVLGLSGEELVNIRNLRALKPRDIVPVQLTCSRSGSSQILNCFCRIDTPMELTYYKNDGILHYIIRNMLN